MTGETIKEDPERNELVVRRDSISAWAAKNAYSLVFLSIMFFVTWVLIFVIGLVYGAPS
jgi:hypothetical protein